VHTVMCYMFVCVVCKAESKAEPSAYSNVLHVCVCSL